MQAILPAIEGTNTFVFVISPDSVISKNCAKEITHAAAHNKRMIPVMARDVSDEAVPAPLAPLNRIFARESDSFDEAIDKLVSALDTDLDWVRAHTGYLIRAIEWDIKARSNSSVLRGEDLQTAEKWLAQAGDEKERQPTALQTEYIIASRKAASRRQRIMLGATTTGLIIASVLTGLAYVFMVKAQTAKAEAQKALTGSFLRTIGVSEDNALRPDESAALWELAALDPANWTVRKRLIESWLSSEDGVRRALLRGEQGLHAAVGFDEDLRTLFAQGAGEAAKRVAKKLEDPQEINGDVLSGWSRALIGLANRMESPESAKFADGAARALITKVEQTEGFRFAILNTGRLRSALVALAQRLTPVQATTLANNVAPPLGDAGMTHGSWLRTSTFAALTLRMEPGEVARLADRLVQALGDPAMTDSSRLAELSHALEALAPRVEPPHAASLASSLTTRLQEQQVADTSDLSELSDALSALAARLEPPNATHLAQRVSSRLDDSQETDVRLLGALAALAPRVESPQVESLAERVTTRLVDPRVANTSLLSTLCDALEALAPRVEPPQGTTLARRVTNRLRDPQLLDTFVLSELTAALEALAPRVEPAQAAGLAEDIITRLESLQQLQTTSSLSISDAHFISGLSDALAAFAPSLERTHAANLAERVTRCLQNPQVIDTSVLLSFSGAVARLVDKSQTTDFLQTAAVRIINDLEKAQNIGPLSDLSSAVVTLARRMEPAHAASFADSLTTRLEDRRVTAPDVVSSLSDALASLAARLDPAQAAGLAERLTNRLEDPQTSDTTLSSSLSSALTTLARHLPEARHLQLVALSHLLRRFPAPRDESKPSDLQRLVESYAMLKKEELAAVMKWPLCVGEAQKLALAEMEKKTGQKFDGDLWKFVKLAPSLGIKEIKTPARRPNIKEAREELERLRQLLQH